MKRVYAFAAISMLLAAPATAAELNHFFKSPRALGMGNAFTAVSNDTTALFYNPAGLNKIDTWNLTIFNPYVEGGQNILDAESEINDTDLNNNAELADLLRNHIGETFHASFGFYPGFSKKHFAFAVLAQGEVNATPHTPQNPRLEIDSKVSGSAHIGYARGFFDEKLSVGAAGKFVHMESLSKIYTVVEMTADDFQDRVEDDMVKGDGFGIDLGAIYEMPIFFHPAVGVTVHNILETDLGDAGELPTSIDIGFSATQKFADDWITLTLAADYVDITNELSSDDDVTKRLHGGMELWLSKRLALRAGMNQGYFTAGATLNLWVVSLTYATYAEELGLESGTVDDRRHVVQAALEF